MSEAARLAPATIAHFQRQIEAARKQCTPVHTAVSQIQFDQARAVATAYLVLSKADPSSKALLERMIGHAFFGGVSVATGWERTIDYVRKSIRYDEQRRKQSEAAWDTSRKRTKWRDEARLLYDQVMPAEPHLKTAPKIIDRMNELKRIRGSSPAQLLALVRQWRSEARKSGL